MEKITKTRCKNCGAIIERIPTHSLYDEKGKLQKYKTCFCANTHILVEDKDPLKWEQI